MGDTRLADPICFLARQVLIPGSKKRTRERFHGIGGGGIRPESPAEGLI